MRKSIPAARVSAVILALLLLITVIFPVSISASEAQTEPVSATDMSGVFIPAEYLPWTVEKPTFYLEVTNVSCLYVFSDVSGIVHKRYYGTINGVAGFYAAFGETNTVEDNSLPIDTEDDKLISAEYQLELRNEGKLPGKFIPDEKEVDRVDTIFGIPFIKFIIYAIGGAVLFLGAIMLAASWVRRRQGTDE
ncbi:MAG: hypothetical protein LBL82_04815 [Oscillospiraceae bacterium]|nr:hypothetical protein [Oscillospiraceae bacterium]